MNETEEFNGFDEPTENWSKLPHVFIGQLPKITSLTELKVVLYILRHTWGYKEYDSAKPITTDEFANGRKKKDGTRIDKGIGMSEPSIRAGIKSAISHGFIKVSIDSTDLARIEKSYQLNIHGNGGVKDLPSGGKEFTSGGLKVNPRSEKETLDKKQKRETDTSQSPQPGNSDTVKGNPPVLTKKRSEKSPTTVSGWLSRLPAVRAVVVEMLNVCYEGWDAAMMTPENCLTVHQLENYITNAEEYARLGGSAGEVGQVYEFVADQVDYTIAPKTLAGYFLRWKASQAQQTEPIPSTKKTDEPKREMTETERAERLAEFRANRATLFG